MNELEPRPASERRRLLEKLLRELLRSETLAIEHPAREARRIGETSPVSALREVALHAQSMRPRLMMALEGHDMTSGRGGITATLSTLRQLVTDRLHDAERAFRAALLDLRHGVDVVRIIREVARMDQLFSLIRWCDDWIAARRTLVASVEAQLGWFAEQHLLTPATVRTDSVSQPVDQSAPESHDTSHKRT